jgi:multiple sugar transport system substrate-binding protein
MNYKLKWRRLPVMLALVMALSTILSACGTPAAGDEPITLKMMIVDYVQDKTDKWLADEAIPAFQKAHPNIKVETIYVSWGTLDETVQGYFTAGEGADIINLGSEYIPQYGDRLAPLNQYLGAEAWADIKQYVKSTLDTVTWKGELRGLPWLTAPRAYMCRTDLAKSTTTYADAVTEAKKATKIEGNAVKQAGIVTTGRLDDWQEWVSLIWGLGSQLYKEDGTPTFDSAEAKASLKFMYDRRRAVYPDETVADLPEAQGSRLADGTAACVWGNLWGAPATDDALWSKIELSPGPTDPAFPASKPVIQVFNDWLAVPGYSKHIPEAAEFLKFLGSAENQNRYNSDFGSFPPRRDAWTGYVAKDGIMGKMGDLMEKYGIGFADIRESAKLREILQKEMPAYFTDAQDLDSTLTNIQTQYTQVLKDAKMIK